MARQIETAFVFSGIGTQWEGMGAALLAAYPVFAEGVEAFDAAFSALSGWSVLPALRGAAAAGAGAGVTPVQPLASAATGHPCIVAMEIGLTRLLAAWGIQPAAVLGHSGGEVAAAVAAGALTVEDAARVAWAHSQVLTRTAGQGAMAHIGLAPEALAVYLRELPGIEIAAFNSPSATVISGTRGAIEAAAERIARASGAFCRVLRTDVPFHTAMLEGELEAFTAALAGVAAREPAVAVYSSLLGRRMHAQERMDAGYWREHIRRPVAFTDAARALLGDGYARVIEVSPHAVLLEALAECAGIGAAGASATSGATGATGVVESAKTPLLCGTLARGEESLPLLSRLLSRLEESGLPIAWAKTGLQPAGAQELTSEARALAALPAGARPGAMTAVLLQVLQQAAAGQIEVREGLAFREMGVTSLMAVKMTRALEKRLGLSLSAALLFNYPDVPALAGFLLGKLAPQDANAATGAAAGTGAGAADAREPLAVVGIACRLPGGADTPGKLWELVAQGRDVVGEVPASRWDINRYYDADPVAPGKMHTREGGFLREAVDGFDARFFNISAREAVQLDPQQRLLLEVVWEAFERGGIPVASLRGSRTGVFLGISSLDYTHAHRDSYHRDRIDAYSLTGTTFSGASGRISYLFGFEGPCFAVDTACSSSLVALHCASRSLRSGESEAAVVTGVNLMLIPDLHICFTKLGATAPDGRSKAFDDGADGYGRGEGAVAIVLKRLSDAQRDGNRIFGLLRGTAVNQDGRSNGLTAPNGLAQQKVVTQALADAGLRPEEVSYVEAHGTGTALGDSIELEALGAAYCRTRDRAQPLLVGSVKANIGHLEPAAGLAGITKLLQCLQHRQIPANIHVKTPNTRFDWKNIPLSAPTALTEWSPAGARRAGVSAFGFSGTNAHAIFEEAPKQPRRAGGLPGRFVLPLSARSAGAVKELARRAAALLPGADAAQLADLCYTAAAGRTHFEWRAIASGADAQELLRSLEAAQPAQARGGRVAFVFTGQGSQYVGMGRGLYETWPVFRATLEECAAVLREDGIELMALLYGPEASAQALENTELAQPAIAAVEIALYRQWLAWGVRPEVVIGHSIGEYPAAVAAGILELAQMLRLVVRRGRLMREHGGAGAMAAVSAGRAAVEAVLAGAAGAGGLDGVTLAADNAPEAVTLSGPAQALGRALEALKAAGIACKPLAVSGAFHSPAMAGAREAFYALLQKETFLQPTGPALISTVDPALDAARLCDAAYWADQIVRPVNFRAAVVKAGESCGVFVEIGATTALSGLAGQTLPQAAVIPSLHPKKENVSTALEALGALYAAGFNPDFEAVYAPFGVQRAELPTYPFERQPYWMEVCVNPPSGATDEAVPGRRLDSPAIGSAAVFETVFDDNGPIFLHEHIIYGQAISPAAGHIAMMLAAARELWGAPACELTDLEFLQPLLVLKKEARLVQVILDDASGAEAGFRIVSRPQDGGDWLTHCTGRIKRGAGDPPAEQMRPGSSELAERFPDATTKQDFYSDFIGVGYELGEGFLRIEEITLGEAEAFCRVETRRGTPGERGHVLYPGAVDSILQTMLPSFLRTYMKEMLSDGSTLIPMHMDRVRFFAPAGANVWCHSRTRREDAALMRGDILALDEAGRPLMAMDGVLMRKTTREVLYRQLAGNLSQMLYSPAFLPAQSVPSVLSATQAAAGGALRAPVAVIASAASAFATAVAQAVGGSLQVCPSASAAQGVLAAGAGTVVYVCAPDGSTGATGATTGANEVAECGLLLELARGLSGTAAVLWAVTGGAAAVPLAEGLRGAAVWGAGRTVAVEVPEIWGGLIDLPQRPHEADFAALTAVLAGARRRLCAVRDGAAQELVLQKVQPKAQAAGEALFRGDRTYLVTGGFGALGLRTAQWLAENGAGHIVLTGRSDRSAACAPALAQIRSAGATGAAGTSSVTVRGIAADIADEQAVRTMIAEIERTMPPLDGVFHAAGILEDALLADMNAEKLRRVMEPKVQGTLNLEAATAGCALRYFVLYSSAATILGSQGQANYSAGNQFMNTLALRRQAVGKPALSVCWGPWDEAGMAAEDARRGARLAGQGILGLSTKAAFEGLRALLAAGTAVGCVMPMDWKRFAQASGAAGDPYFAVVVPASDAAGHVGATGGGAAKEPFAKIYEATPEAVRPALVQGWLQEIGREVLGFADKEQLLPDQPLMEQGLDSLMAVDIRNRLNRELGQSLPAAVLFNYPTIRALGGYIQTLLTPETARQTPGKVGEAPAQATQPASEADALLSEIDDLLK